MVCVHVFRGRLIRSSYFDIKAETTICIVMSFALEMRLRASVIAEKLSSTTDADNDKKSYFCWFFFLRKYFCGLFFPYRHYTFLIVHIALLLRSGEIRVLRLF